VNVEIKDIKSVYFIGIGGIGMSALARYFKSVGKTVWGYDKTQTHLTIELEKEGIPVHFSDDPDQFKNVPDLVVYTPAIPKEHKELIWLQQHDAVIKKRSEVLGLITKDTFSIGIAGTHGKTTITSMVAHMLKQSGKDPFAFIGGITKNYGSNLLLSQTNEISVIEADEFDRSFLQLFPDIAVISAMDADHLDIYGDKEHLTDSFFLFAEQIKHGGTLILRKSLPIPTGLKVKLFTYGLDESADIYASDIRVEDGHYFYKIIYKGELLCSVKAGIPGIHNVENALASAAIGVCVGIQNDQIKKAIETYQGVQRRFDYRINEKELVFIDDYAHHPEEIKAFLRSVRQLYPEKKITGVFQPHLFTRTRDFAAEFAKSLEMLDEVILLDIYPARELPIPGIDSKMLLDQITGVKRKDLYKKEELIEALVKRNLEVLVTLGAGDIDQLVEPIEKTLKNILKLVKGLE
jgi:UDP-N-acetylmuramate--alanine ligase